MSEGPFAGASGGGGAGTKPCRACGTPIPSAATFCSWCNAPQAGAPRCPQCRAATGASPDAELRFVCNVCGAARVVLDTPALTLSGAENAPLREVRGLRGSRAMWRIGGVLGVLGTLAGWAFVGLWSALFGFSLLLTVMVAAVSIPLVLLAFAAMARSRSKTNQIAEAVRAAWSSAAAQVAQQLDRPFTPKQLAQLLPVKEPEAEKLLNDLVVQDVLRADVTDEGVLAYASASPRRPMRIDPALLGEGGASSPPADAAATARAVKAASVRPRPALRATMVGGQAPTRAAAPGPAASPRADADSAAAEDERAAAIAEAEAELDAELAKGRTRSPDDG